MECTPNLLVWGLNPLGSKKEGTVAHCREKSPIYREISLISRDYIAKYHWFLRIYPEISFATFSSLISAYIHISQASNTLRVLLNQGFNPSLHFNSIGFWFQSILHCFPSIESHTWISPLKFSQREWRVKSTILEYKFNLPNTKCVK